MSEAQRHAAGTLRNLTVGDHVKVGFCCSALKDQSCPEAQRHAAGTLRNLTVGDHVKVGSESTILFPC